MFPPPLCAEGKKKKISKFFFSFYSLCWILTLEFTPIFVCNVDNRFGEGLVFLEAVPLGVVVVVFFTLDRIANDTSMLLLLLSVVSRPLSGTLFLTCCLVFFPSPTTKQKSIYLSYINKYLLFVRVRLRRLPLLAVASSQTRNRRNYLSPTANEICFFFSSSQRWTLPSCCCLVVMYPVWWWTGWSLFVVWCSFFSPFAFYILSGPDEKNMWMIFSLFTFWGLFFVLFQKKKRTFLDSLHT